MIDSLPAADRRGAALVLALLMLVVLDCIVIGTLHLSLLEHRIGANRAMLLRQRLDAESGARLALGHWSARIDSMRTGGQSRVPIPDAGAGTADVQIERLGDRLFLVHSVAVEPEPRVGRSSARLLLTPPALPPGVDPAPAPLTSAGSVHVLPTGVLRAAAPAGCGAAAGTTYTALVADPSALSVDSGAQLDAPHGPIVQPSVIAAYDRIAGLAGRTAYITIVAGDTILFPPADSHPAGVATPADTGPVPHVLIVGGSLTVAAGALVRGLVLSRGGITVEAGASVHGAVHAGGNATIAGAITLDRCAVAGSIEASGLDRPAPAGPRAWLPF